MKKMRMGKLDVAAGTASALFSYLFGDQRILFLIFFFLNLINVSISTIIIRISGKKDFKNVKKVILKKARCWIIVLIAFGCGTIFIQIGKAFGIDMGMAAMLGWFVLASLIISELRLICSDLIDAGFEIPEVFLKGLEIAERAVDEEEGTNILSENEE